MGSDESHFNVSVESDGQRHRTVSTNHNLSYEKEEPKRYCTEVLPLTSLTPYHVAKPAHSSRKYLTTSWNKESPSEDHVSRMPELRSYNRLTKPLTRPEYGAVGMNGLRHERRLSQLRNSITRPRDRRRKMKERRSLSRRTKSGLRDLVTSRRRVDNQEAAHRISNLQVSDPVAPYIVGGHILSAVVRAKTNKKT